MQKNDIENMKILRFTPYIICPDSGNEYPISSCTGMSLCSCGCKRNLKDLLEEQENSNKLYKVSVWVNTIVVSVWVNTTVVNDKH